MNITLKPEQEKFIHEKVKSGKYTNTDEVIEAALKLLEEQERRLHEQQLAELQEKIASGTEQIAKGQVTDGEEVFARLQEKIRLISES